MFMDYFRSEHFQIKKKRFLSLWILRETIVTLATLAIQHDDKYIQNNIWKYSQTMKLYTCFVYMKRENEVKIFQLTLELPELYNYTVNDFCK